MMFASVNGATGERSVPYHVLEGIVLHALHKHGMIRDATSGNPVQLHCYGLKITTMQSSTSKTVAALRSELERLHVIARTACGNMSHIAKNEADLALALRVEKEKAAKFQAELLEFKSKYQTVYSENKQFSVTITQVFRCHVPCSDGGA